MNLLFAFLLIPCRCVWADEAVELLDQLVSEPAEARARAAVRLGELGDDRAIGPLIERLQDPDVETRWQAAMALSRFGARAAPDLVAALKFIEDEPRWKAGTALKQMGRAAVPALLDGLNGRDALVRAESAYLLGEIGDPAAADALAAALGDADEPTRWKAAVALQRLQAVPALIRALEAPEARKRQTACWALGEIASAEVIPVLARALGDENLDVRWKAAVALAARKEAALVEVLKALNFGRLESRRCAAWVLQGFQDVRAIPALIRAIGAEDDELRWKAALALEKFGSAGVPSLVEAVEEGGFELQQMALMVLKRVSTPEAAAALKRFEDLADAAGPGDALATLSGPGQWRYVLLPSPAPAEYDFALIVHLPAGGLGLHEFRIAFDYRSERDFLYLSVREKESTLVEVRGGEEHVRDRSAAPAKLRRSIPLRLQRFSRQVRAYSGSTLLAAASLPASDPPGFGYAGLACTAGDVRFSHPRIQPFAPIQFSDDFMRGSLTGGEWTPLSGHWALNSVLGPETSTNPFRCLGQGAEALCLAGHPFWDRYRFSLHVQPLDAAACGLAFGYRNPANYYLFRWLQEGGESALFQLLRREDGTVQTLAATRGRRRPGQWYELAADVLDGRLRLWVDDTRIFDLAEDRLHSGRIGLYTESELGTLFDDVSVENGTLTADDFQKMDGGARFWSVEGRGWKIGFRSAWDLSTPNAIALHASRRPGWTTWQDVLPEQARIRVRVRSADGRAGFFFGPPGASEAWAAWLEADRLVFGRPAAARDTPPLTARIPRVKKWDWRELEIVRRGRRWTFRAGGSAALDAAFNLPGPVSLWSEGCAAASFDDFQVEALPAARPLPMTHRIFRNYVDMDNWAKSSSIWQPRAIPGAEGIIPGHEHAGDYFGDVAIEAPLPPAGPSQAAVALFLAEEAQPQPVAVGVWSRPAGQMPRLELQVGGGPARSLQLDTGHTAAALRLERVGGEIRLSLRDAEVALPLPEGKLATTTRCGFGSQGCGLPPDDVRLFSETVLDDMFERAFVEWESHGGDWGVTNRWICSPQYSWMGGGSSAVAALWSKRPFLGDQTIEYFAGIKMDLAGPPYYSRRADLNLTICGDGENLDSGYAFIFGGWNNTRTRLLRKGETVAEATTVLFPGGGHDAIHHRWFHVRMARRGPRVLAALDGKTIFDYEDPNPISGGHAALWTWKNGMIVARVRAAAQTLGPRRSLLERPAANPTFLPIGVGQAPAVSFPLHLDFENDAGPFQTLDGDQGAALSLDDSCFRSGRRSLRLGRLHAGGTFAAMCVPAAFDAARFPWLRFDYRAGPDVKVDFFVRSRGQVFTLGFTLTRDPAKCLAVFPDVQADGEWHSTGLNLAEALAAKFPGTKEAPVDSFWLGNSSQDDYLQCGFGGNHAGVAWHLDNFRIGPE